MKNSNENKNDNNLLTLNDFEELNFGTLVRYKTFFNIPQDTDKLKDKSNLANLVNDHFNNLEIDDNEVISRFLKIEKDNVTLNNSSLRKSVRNIDRLDKLSFKQKNKEMK